MTEGNDQVPEPHEQEQIRRCPTCAAAPRLTHEFLNPLNGKTVRLFECQCGERIWDD